MLCTACGANNSLNARYCYECGAGLMPGLTNPIESAQVSPTVGILGSSDHLYRTPLAPPGFFRRHWQGDYPLVVSYWVIGLLLTFIIMAILTALGSQDFVPALGARISGLAILAVYIFAAVITIWQLVGIWRSASKHTDRGGQAFWAGFAKVMVALGAFGAVGDFATQGIHLVKEGARLFAGIDDTPPHDIRLLRNGTELELSGGMSLGTADAVQKTLNNMPRIRVIHLNSQGGWMSEAYRLHKSIDERGLITYTSADCVSACAIAYLGGRERYIGERGRLGFHSVSVGDLDGSVAPGLNDEVRRVLRASGVPDSFADQALSTAAKDMWYPSKDELIRARVVHAVVDSRYFGLSGVAQWRDAHKIESNLLEVPLIAALSRYDPQNYPKVRSILVSGVQQGRAAIDIQKDIRTLVVGGMIPTYLKRAPDEALVRYIRVQIAEMKHLAKLDPKYCAAFALKESSDSTLDLPSLLSKELMREDLDALTEIVKGVAMNPQDSDASPSVLKDLESAMTRAERRRPGTAKILENPAGYKDKPAQLCGAVVALYSEILALPTPARSGAILRHMFDG